MSSSPSPSYYSFGAPPSPSSRHRRSTSSFSFSPSSSPSSSRRHLLSSPSSSPRPSCDLISAQRHEIRSKLEPFLFAPPKSIISLAKDIFTKKSPIKKAGPKPTFSVEEVVVAQEMYTEWISSF